MNTTAFPTYDQGRIQGFFPKILSAYLGKIRTIFIEFGKK